MSLFAISTRPDIITRIAAREAARTRHEVATDQSALTLSQEMAAWLNAPVDQVFHTLCNVPGDLPGLLQEPKGWAALADYLAGQFGCEGGCYRPVVH